MARFTKKPVTIDAILAGEVMDGATSGRFAESTLRDGETLLPQWVIDAFTNATFGFESVGDPDPAKRSECVVVNTHHGQARAERGDWIIRGVDGELYPCKADVFARTYDAVPDGWVENPFDKLDAVGADPSHPTHAVARAAIEAKMDGPPVVYGKLWEVYRCGEAAPNEACGIRETSNGIATLIVSDTNREECCHHMQLADAAHIVQLHNDHVLGSPVITIKGDISSEQFREFREKWNREVSSIASRALIVDSDPPRNMSAPEPPPVRRDDLKPAWEIVIEEFRDRYCVGDYLTDTSAAAAVRDVLDDMTARDATGRAKYGVPLTAHNGRDQLVDAYQELLDASVYLRAAMEEGISGASAVYSNTLHNIFWLRVAINSRAARAA